MGIVLEKVTFLVELESIKNENGVGRVISGIIFNHQFFYLQHTDEQPNFTHAWKTHARTTLQLYMGE